MSNEQRSTEDQDVRTSYASMWPHPLNHGHTISIRYFNDDFLSKTILHSNAFSIFDESEENVLLQLSSQSNSPGGDVSETALVPALQSLSCKEVPQLLTKEMVLPH